MTSPLGEEFIAIRPLLSGFRAELNAQLAAALSGVGPQVAAAQSRLLSTVGSTSTLKGLPVAAEAATLATTRLGTATKNTATRTTAAGAATRNLSKELSVAETSAGRYTRGLFAATAASSGLFRAVSFASGAFLAGAIAGGVITSAVQKFADTARLAAQTAALLRATGGAANVSARQIANLADEEQRLTGISNDTVQASENVLLSFRLIRNEAGAGNQVFTRSVKALLDISSVMGTDLSSTAIQLGKALEDPVRGVTALRRSGISLSQSQRDLIKRLVETGRTLTAQKIILSEIEHQVGGTANAVGRTLPGQLNILKARAREALGEYAKRVSESQKVTETFQAVVAGLGGGFRDFGAAAKGALAPLVLFVRAVGEIPGAGKATLSVLRTTVQVVTFTTASYVALKVALEAASLFQGIYRKATTVAAAATVAEGAAAETAAVRIGLMDAALAGLSGPLGIALGITALTIGVLKLRQAAANAPGTFNAMTRSLNALNDAVERGRKLTTAVAGRNEDISVARFNVLAAQREQARAQAAAARSPAIPGSPLAIHLAGQVAAADAKLTQANKDLVDAIRQRDIAEAQLAQNQRSRQFVIAETTQKFQDQIKAFRQGHDALVSLFGVPIVLNPVGLIGPGPQRSLDQFRDRMQKLIAQGTPLENKVGGALLTIANALDRIPTSRQISIVVRAIGRGLTTNQALQLLGIGREAGTEQTRLVGLVAPGVSATQEQIFQGLKAALETDNKHLKVLKETLAQRRDELQTINDTVHADKEALQTAQDARAAAIQAIADARQSLADVQQQQLDTIRQAHEAVAQAIRDSKQAVNDAVQSAKANLTSIGQTIAGILTDFATAGGKLGTGKLGANFQALKEQVLAGGGGPETQAEAQRLTARLQVKAPDVTDLTRKFNDLTDLFERGKISLPQFNRRFADLIKGVNVGEIRKTLGPAVANAFNDAIQTFRRQARAIAAGPQRPGGAVQNTLIKPLQAVADGAKAIAAARVQAAKDIAAAARDVANANRGVKQSVKDLQRANQNLADAQHKLIEDQRKATKANTDELKAHTRVTKELVTVEKARLKFEGFGAPRPKPRGDAASTAGNLTTSGAQAP